jgi:putative FmdB family regulatory protein
MPSYDFRCESCKKRVVLSYKTYANYDAATPTCPLCGSTRLTRIITRVAIAKSEERRFGDLSDETALDDMANADPTTMGRYMRKMSDQIGEDLGEEFNDVVDRLERGQSPEEIESQLSPLPDESTGASLGAAEIE